MSDELTPIRLFRDAGNWKAYMREYLVEVGMHGPASITEAVSACRKAAQQYSEAGVLTVKVAEGTRLTRDELFEIVEAAGSAQCVDASNCVLEEIDLSREAVAPLAIAFKKTNNRSPLWFNENLGTTDISWINLSGSLMQRADLRGILALSSKLTQTSLTEAHLEGANLQFAKMEHVRLGNADLTGAELSGAFLEGAQVTGATFDEAKFDFTDLAGIDFYHARSVKHARWYGSVLDRTRIRRGQLGSAIKEESAAHKERSAEAYRQASEAYLLHKNNFLSIGRYDDASWAAVRERQMAKMQLYWGWRRGRIFSKYESEYPLDWRNQRPITFLMGWLVAWVFEALTGFGERPLRPVAWASALAFIVFPSLYWAAGALPGWASMKDHIIFSLTTFGTLSFNGLQPDSKLGTILSACEAFSAVMLFALFAFTLGNRMKSR
ncbi:MAG: pentapeptide repeat-containing protein [Dehalococcoidia bacterium]|nr:pentapeptide repeat-containing protein [Dehalococcoidia bacterium]